MDIVFLLGRVLFAAIFLFSAIGHVAQATPMSQYAESKGVPNAKQGVIASGIIAGIAGVSIVLGIWIDVGALLVIAFLVPVSLFMHPFWKETDPMTKQAEQASFMKNVALIGGALILFYLANQAQGGLGITLTDPLFGRG
ncbi:MAG: DoxX family protein [Solirubrobacteraceae bacterium]